MDHLAGWSRPSAQCQLLIAHIMHGRAGICALGPAALETETRRKGK